MSKYKKIFPDDLPSGLPPQRPYDHKIELERGAQVTVRSQWRLSQPELMELRTQLDYLLEKKIILFTPKKDGGLWMCTDYQALNNITNKSRYPIPRADGLIDQLRGGRIFPRLIYDEVTTRFVSQKLIFRRLLFETRYQSYKYTVMPFGLTNAPSIFQLTMNKVFRLLLDKCGIVYLDDILVYRTLREQHLTDLEAVFTLCDQHRLITKGSMCKFLKEELEFMGHVVSTEGVKIDPKKIDTIHNWEPPTNV
ncbi:hypothetical protein CLOM_g16924 [Closterium sp. NIES-68]|nr:hypothetical protein CLOM_g16924 [Closterium sp. NIES-68]GJP65448.1 hypothetical protein CLOP_g22322 [Closterium sp. NIES-67]